MGFQVLSLHLSYRIYLKVQLSSIDSQTKFIRIVPVVILGRVRDVTLVGSSAVPSNTVPAQTKLAFLERDVIVYDRLNSASYVHR
jgi:hypothetical protein